MIRMSSGKLVLGPNLQLKTCEADASEKIQAGYVIPGREEHQPQHHNQP
jgi:hypothetical protein